jgi:phosphomannomutase
MAEDETLDLGLANDGDADRIGLYDGRGEFVDSHHILLLLLQYMVEHKKQDGKVVVTFSVTNKMRQLADQYGLEFEVTPVGFKYIAEIMMNEAVIVGGEESGGLAVQSHLPERDGIWMGLLVMEFMAKSGKSLHALIESVYEKVGAFAYDRDDRHVSDAHKTAVIQHCQTSPFTSFGAYQVQEFEDLDGFKFTIDDDTWTMIRPSGTEPVLRVYGQARDAGSVRDLLDAVNAEIDRLA